RGKHTSTRRPPGDGRARRSPLPPAPPRPPPAAPRPPPQPPPRAPPPTPPTVVPRRRKTKAPPGAPAPVGGPPRPWHLRPHGGALPGRGADRMNRLAGCPSRLGTEPGVRVWPTGAGAARFGRPA